MTPRESRGRDARYRVPALERGLALLRQFSPERPTLSLSELGRRLGLAPSTVFRLAYTLEQTGLLHKAPENRGYRLGAGVLTLGFTYLSSLEIAEVARPFLERLRDATGANVHLAARDRDDLVYLVRVPAKTSLVSNIQVGTRMPLHCNAMGQVLLADLTAAALSELYRGRKLAVMSDRTPANLSQLRRVLEQARREGCVIAQGAIYPEVASVAAPVRNAAGAAIAAINVVAPEAALLKAGIDTTIKPAVLRAAFALSQALGYRMPRRAKPRATVPAASAAIDLQP